MIYEVFLCLSYYFFMWDHFVIFRGVFGGIYVHLGKSLGGFFSVHANCYGVLGGGGLYPTLTLPTLSHVLDLMNK